MSDVTSILGAAGARPCIEHNGKLYSVRPVTWAVKSEFEQWLKDQALAVLNTIQGERFMETVRALSDDMASGKYSFHGELCQKALATPGGVFAMMRILFQCSEEELTQLILHHGQKVRAMVEVAVAQSKPKGSEGNG